MKKYILILFWFSGFAQFNPLQWYEFGNTNTEANTFIGGIGSTINTPALLAPRLGVIPNRIKNFKVLDGNISCSVIGGGYNMAGDAFNPSLISSQITYFEDKDGLCININEHPFRTTTSLSWVHLNNCLSIKRQTFSGSSVMIAEFKSLLNILEISNNWNNSVKILYIPNLLMGSPSINEGNLANLNSAKIYVNSALKNNNAGLPDADITAAITQGCTIVYVEDFTLPDSVVDLSSPITTATTATLSFTTPSSVNGIDYYEVYLDGIYYQKLVGITVTGLTTGTNYNIELKAVDNFYNKSAFSNKINVTTL